jgi:hypothetical protein
MLRYSLGALLVAVLVVAVGCAALVNPTPLWSQIVFTSTLVLILGAVVAAAAAWPRPFATGFAIFGGAYLLLACGTWATLVRPHLLTETALAKLEPLVIDPNQSATQTQLWLTGASFDPNVGSTLWGGPNALYNINGGYVSVPSWPYQLVVSDGGSFRQIGHSLWAIVLGALGGAVARLAARRRVPRQGV